MEKKHGCNENSFKIISQATPLDTQFLRDGSDRLSDEYVRM